MEPILSLDRLGKRFGGLTAVSGLSFDVTAGEILGLIGPNGAGKSTTFNLIAGQYSPDEGKIRFKGRDITCLPPHRVCHTGIARTYQIPQPFTKLSSLKNVMVAAKFGQGLNMESSAREAERLLDLVGLSDKKDVLAKDLPVFSLKKLELARALASNPKVLLLDEVAAGATEAEVPRILGIISQIRKIGITVIMVEHVMKIIMKAVDRLIVMDKGVKIAEGFPNEIMENRTVIEAYLGKFAGHQGTPARGK